MKNLSSDKQTRNFDTQVDELRNKLKGLDHLKVRDDVFDEYTLLGLFKLLSKGWLTEMCGPISTGKEANIYLALRKELPVAVKIYLTRTANFKKMQNYILGDRRFFNIGKTRRDIIFAWTRKEYSNLLRAEEAGIEVPHALVFDRNILVIEFLGEGMQPYPKLRDSKPENDQLVYDKIISAVETLWNKANLVHGDLSEYNILYGGGKPYLIDMGQAVTTDHPYAAGFLKRDLEQINTYYRNRCNTRDVTEMLDELCKSLLQ